MEDYHTCAASIVCRWGDSGIATCGLRDRPLQGQCPWGRWACGGFIHSCGSGALDRGQTTERDSGEEKQKV